MDDRLFLQPEDCLRLFLRACSEADEAWLLARLVPGQAEEIARRIIRRAVRNEFDAGNTRHELAEDLLHETYSNLIGALRRMKAVGRGDGEAIRSYERWVARTTINVCHDRLRDKYPRRRRLKDELRKLFKRHPSFSVWRAADGVWECGRAEWQHDVGQQQKPRPLSAGSIAAALGDDDCSLRAKVELAELIEVIFDRAGGPVLFDQLVTVIADVRGEKEHLTVSDDSAFFVTSAEPDVAEGMEQRELLRGVWRVVCELPVEWRAALLLKQIGEGGTRLFTVFEDNGIASLDEIARALVMSTAQLTEIEDDRDFKDAAIGAYFGVSSARIAKMRFNASQHLRKHLGAAATVQIISFTEKGISRSPPRHTQKRARD